MSKGAELTLPAKWALASFALFYEAEDLSKDPRPFAGSVLVQLRTDVPRGASTADVQQRDLSSAQARIPSLTVIGRSKLALPGGVEVEYLEWMFPDAAVETVQQLVLYVTHRARLYTVTATHRHDRFEVIRGDVLQIASDVRKSGAKEARR